MARQQRLPDIGKRKKQHPKNALDEARSLTQNQREARSLTQTERAEKKRQEIINFLKANRKGCRGVVTTTASSLINSWYDVFFVMERDDYDGTYFFLSLSDGLTAWSYSTDELTEGGYVQGWLVPPLNPRTSFPVFIIDERDLNT